VPPIKRRDPLRRIADEHLDVCVAAAEQKLGFLGKRHERHVARQPSARLTVWPANA
jgi:hypothetical protein